MFKKPYEARERVVTSFMDDDGNVIPSLTVQAQKADCDIVNIMSRYDKTGLITHVNTSVAQYGDFTEVNEYQDALNLVIRSQNSFAELPSDIRKRFGNDAGAFFEFATNPDNKDELVKMGLANAPVVESLDSKKDEISARDAAD